MPIPLRADFDAQTLRSVAKQSKDGPQARRLLALGAIYEGAGRRRRPSRRLSSAICSTRSTDAIRAGGIDRTRRDRPATY
jgi:hypothetical protein